MDKPFALSSLLERVNKADFAKKWFHQQLTDHTYSFLYDWRKCLLRRRPDEYINAVGLKGIIPDGLKVAIIDEEDSSCLTIGTVQDGLLRKFTRVITHEFRFCCVDLIEFKLSAANLTPLAPSPTWKQVESHINKQRDEWRERRRRFGGQETEIDQSYGDRFSVWATENNLRFKTVIHAFENDYFHSFSQAFVFEMTEDWVFELDAVFQW